MRWLRRFVAKAVSCIVCPSSVWLGEASIALSGRCSQSPCFFAGQLVSLNPLAVECPKRLRHHAGRLLDQTAAALFFIILGKFRLEPTHYHCAWGPHNEPY